MTHLSYERVARQRAAAELAYTRRSLLGGGLKAAGGLAAAGSLSSLLAACGGSSTSSGGSAGGGTLREIGLSLTEDPRILGAAQKELGIKVQGKSDNLGSQITFWKQNYRQFDLNQVNFSQNGALKDTMRSVPVSDIPAWNDSVLELFRKPGGPGYNKKSGWPIAGTYTEQAIASKKYDEFIGVPTWFGFDAFGYLEGKTEGDVKSYGAIFDPGNKGKATLLDEPITTVMKVATYLSGTKQASFSGPINNLTKDDLKTCFDFLAEQKAKGQFRLFWSDFGQLVDLLTAGEVVVGDFWASAVAAAAANGAKAKFVNMPTEGTNGWIQGIVDSKETKNYAAAKKFIDWNLSSGVTGAVLGVQGYYSPRADMAQKKLAAQKTNPAKATANDYEYWYNGAVPAERPALEQRLTNVADWQAYPDEFPEYGRLWTEFTSA
jgi:spermidine/putrescine-binding protein